MKQMVMMVLNNPDHCMTLMEAWEAAGAPGITILESTGLVRMRQAGMRDDLPLLPSLSELFRGSEEHHRTIFTVVDGDEMVQAVISATEQVIDDLDKSNDDESGLLFVVPVTSTHRFSTRKAREKDSRHR